MSLLTPTIPSWLNKSKKLRKLLPKNHTANMMTILVMKSEKLKYSFLLFSLNQLFPKAFLETLEQRDKFDSLKAKASEKQKSETEDLHKVLAGKTTMKSLFSKKSKDEEAQELEKVVAAVYFILFCSNLISLF